MNDKPKQFNQFKTQPQVFDAYNKDLPIQTALGSKRGKERLEASDLRSTNWEPGVAGWRLTPTGIEFGDTSGAFPPGSIALSTIQTIATDKLLGRDTAGYGSIEQLGVGAGLSISGGNLVCSITQNNTTQYTDEMAQDAIGNNVGNGLDYNDTSGAISVDETELAHNSIGSKQGGTTNEYYHLTNTEHTAVGTIGNKADASDVPLISSGTSAPATTPGKVGDMFIDTVAKKIYIATGNSSSADWIIIN